MVPVLRHCGACATKWQTARLTSQERTQLRRRGRRDEEIWLSLRLLCVRAAADECSGGHLSNPPGGSAGSAEPPCGGKAPRGGGGSPSVSQSQFLLWRGALSA